MIGDIKSGNNIMYTFTIVVHKVNVYIILLPPLIDRVLYVIFWVLES